MQTGQLELMIDAKAGVGESPSWDSLNNRLLWVDIAEKRVHIYDNQSGINRTLQLNDLVGAVVPCQSGGAIAAFANGFHHLDLDTGKLSFLCDPESHLPDNRFNDGKCDAAGRFWAGTMSMMGGKKAGTLYCLDTDLKVRSILSGVTVSNGIGWSPDDKVMYYIDSPTRRIDAFDFDLDTGTVRNRRVVVQIPQGAGNPDGMTVDEEGMLWVAQWDGYCVSRWNPTNGILLQTINVPAARASSCVFGGEHLDELYITSARRGIADNELVQTPHAGGIFRVKPGIKGLPAYSFRG